MLHHLKPLQYFELENVLPWAGMFHVGADRMRTPARRPVPFCFSFTLTLVAFHMHIIQAKQQDADCCCWLLGNSQKTPLLVLSLPPRLLLFPSLPCRLCCCRHCCCRSARLRHSQVWSHNVLRKPLERKLHVAAWAARQLQPPTLLQKCSGWWAVSI